MKTTFCRVCGKHFIPTVISIQRCCTGCASVFADMKVSVITHAKSLAKKNKILKTKIRILEMEVAKLKSKCFGLAQKVV